jgi:hypothetical protein
VDRGDHQLEHRLRSLEKGRHRHNIIK